MGVLIWHELTLIVRTGAFWAASCFYLSVLVLFVLIWGDGVPLAGSGTNWEQFVGLQQALLTVVLPWTAVRCGSRARRDFTILALVTALPPSRLLLATVVALAISLFGLAILGLPFALIMQQLAALPMEAPVTALVPLAALASFVAVLATACGIVMTDVLAAWIATTALVITVSVVIPLGAPTALLWFGLASLLVVPLVLGANARLMYLGDGK